jgi:hypothetical protein
MPRSGLRATISACLDKAMPFEEAEKRMKTLRESQESVGNVIVGYAVEPNDEIEDDTWR